MVESHPAKSNKTNGENEPFAATSLAADKPLPTVSESRNCRRDEERDCYDYISLLIALVGLGGLWYYANWSKVQAVGTLIAAQSASNAANAAKDSAEAELVSVRAWLVPFDIKPPPIAELKPGDSFEIDFQNDGKTIALEPAISETFAFWDKGGGKPQSWFSACAINPIKASIRSGSILPDRIGHLTDNCSLLLNPIQKEKRQAHTAAILVHAVCGMEQSPLGNKSG